MATGKTSAVDYRNGCSVHCVGLELWQVESYKMSTRKNLKVEVIALDKEDAKAKAKAMHPDLSMIWPRARKFNPITAQDLWTMRWESFNQAERECYCIAVRPDKGAGLFAYQMPAGKVFMFAVDCFGENKSVSFRGLSKAWVSAIWAGAEEHGEPVPDRAIWDSPEGKCLLRECILCHFDDGQIGL